MAEYLTRLNVWQKSSDKVECLAKGICKKFEYLARERCDSTEYLAGIFFFLQDCIFSRRTACLLVGTSQKIARSAEGTSDRAAR